MRRGLLALMILLSLVLAPTAAFAQDEPVRLPVACGSLAEEDCTILEESSLAMQALSSYAATVDLNMSLRNVPTLPSDLAISVATDGVFSVDPELTARMVALQMAEQDDMMAMMEEMMDVIVDFYYDIAFDMTVDLGVSSEIEDLLSASTGVPFPGELSLPIRMVDGFFYANLDDVGSQVEGLEGVSGWIGFDYGTLMSEAMAQAATQMEEGSMATDPMSMSMANSMNLSMNRELQDAANAYVEVERLDDVEVDGVEAAQFRFTFDLAGFISDPAFIDMFVQQFKMQMEMQAAMGQEAPPVTDADIQMVTDMLPMIAPMLFADLEFDTISTIGLEDRLVYATETNVSWDLSTIITMASAAMQPGAAPLRAGRGDDAPVFDLSVSAANSGFDEEVEIVAPEDVQIIPLEQLQGSETM